MISAKESLEEAILKELRTLRSIAVANFHLSGEEWDALLQRTIKRLRGE